MPELIADLQRALDRAAGLGVPWDDLIVDPGFGFGKTADHNLELLRELDALRMLGRPILLGTSRKSTLGRVLDLPADERLEATLATTALGIAAGTDIVRVHDVEANVRAARMTDAVVRDAGGTRRRRKEAARERPDRPGQHALPGPPRRLRLGAAQPRSRSRSTSSSMLNLQPAGVDDDLEQVGRLRQGLRRRPADRRIRPRTACSRRSPRRSATSCSPTSTSTRSVVRVRKPEVRLGGPLDYAGVEIQAPARAWRPPRLSAPTYRTASGVGRRRRRRRVGVGVAGSASAWASVSASGSAWVSASASGSASAIGVGRSASARGPSRSCSRPRVPLATTMPADGLCADDLTGGDRRIERPRCGRRRASPASDSAWSAPDSSLRFVMVGDRDGAGARGDGHLDRRCPRRPWSRRGGSCDRTVPSG